MGSGPPHQVLYTLSPEREKLSTSHTLKGSTPTSALKWVQEPGCSHFNTRAHPSPRPSAIHGQFLAAAATTRPATYATCLHPAHSHAPHPHGTRPSPPAPWQVPSHLRAHTGGAQWGRRQLADPELPGEAKAAAEMLRAKQATAEAPQVLGIKRPLRPCGHG
jgi:hypothetical protein